MKNKLLSLIIVLGIYIIAAVGAGIFVYFVNPYMNGLLVVFIADIIATVFVFLFSIPFKNASVYDPYWSVAVPVIVLGFYYVSGVAFSALHLLILIPLALWAIRLTYNWCKEFENLKWQDWRYVRYKQQFPKIYLFINLTGIMLMPTLLVFAGCIPLYYLIINTANVAALSIGGAIVLFAMLYQAIADYQMRKFRANLINKDKCIDEGLWRYSRHPNYFGEITVWFGVFIACINCIPWFGAIGFVAILCLFVFVSVPLMEGKMLKSHPQYKDYQKAVPSVLLPLPRKKH